ncbi:hypothetical protein J4234_06585 [Candidatus Woesearchaeota archaeon]|nr:hypothetical protein [Candidatus Woesearchaeota archaeon]
MANAIFKFKFFIANFIMGVLLASAALAQIYTITSFPTFSGGVVYCNGNDARLSCRDSGDGENHQCVPSGANGCQAFEGEDNYGSPGCLIVCQTAAPQFQRCSDGTAEGQCSSNVPLFCQNGVLINMASFCGCPGNLVINGDSCIAPVQRCNDNTPYGICSSTLPLFCQNGTLIQRASICGCPITQTISGDTCIASGGSGTDGTGGTGGTGGSGGSGSGEIGTAGGTSASGNKLRIIDIDAEIDGKKSSNINDNEKIDREAKPGSDIELKVKVKNEFTLSEGVAIEDIRARVVIEGIASGNDIGAESSEFELNAQDGKTMTFRFKVPLSVDEGTYAIAIEAEGEDENGNDQNDDADIELEVEKDTHDLRFISFELFPKAVGCERDVTAGIRIANTGKENEDNILLEIVNDNSGSSILASAVSIKAGSENNVLAKSITFNLGSSLQEGAYSLTSNIYSEDSIIKDRQTARLEVEECGKLESGLVSLFLKESKKQNLLPVWIVFKGISMSYFLFMTLFALFLLFLVVVAAALLIKATD